MRGFFLMIAILCIDIYAIENFTTILNRALKNSSYINESNLTSKQQILKNKILRRLDNPSVDIEYSNYNDGNGYKIGLSQTIRINQKEINDLYKYSNIEEKYKFLKKRALYIKNFSLLFSQYIKNSKLLELKNEEIKIFQKLLDISKDKYLKGVISKKDFSTLKIDLNLQQIKLSTLKQKNIDIYYKILNYGGFKEDIQIDLNYRFDILKNCNQNIDIKFLKMKYKTALKRLGINSYVIKNFKINAEYEKEVFEDITRMGISIPIPIFNQNKEEREIDKIELIKLKMLIRKKELYINNELKSLSNQKKIIGKSIKDIKNILKEEKELISILIDGYKIANISILEILKAKNIYINTKKELIELQNRLNVNHIYTNYLKGCYNE